MRKANENRIVNFGAHIGKKVAEVPDSYIDWFLEDKSSRGYAKRKLKWRGIFGRERVSRLYKRR